MSCSTTWTNTNGGCCQGYTQTNNTLNWRGTAGQGYFNSLYICQPPSYTTSDITPLAWPGANLVGSGCNGGGGCPGGFVGVSHTVSDGCGTYDCKCFWGLCSQCQANQTECGVDPNSSGAAAKMCPTVGGLTPVSYIYSRGTGGAHGTAATAVKIKCTYTGTPTDPFAQDAINAFANAPDLDALQQNFCNVQSFSTLANPQSSCHGYYNGKNNLNAQEIVRILKEKPTSWPDDQSMREAVLNIALGVYSNGDSTPDATTAINMIQTYCLQTNPQWPANDNMRAFINSIWSDTGTNSRTNVHLQSMAGTLVNTYCGTAGQTDPACGCYNAVQLQFDGCKTQGNVPGCAEFAHLNSAFSQAPTEFASIIAHLEQPQFMKPQCVSSNCATANLNPAGPILRTAAMSTFTCQDNESVCLESLKVGGSVAPGATINQQCSSVFNVAQGTVIQATNNNGQLSGSATTVGGPAGSPGGAPITTSTAGPGKVMVQGQAYDLSDFLVQPGKSSFIDKTLPTPTAQKLALGGCIGLVFICCCLILLLLLSGGQDAPSGPSSGNFLAARLATAGS